MTTIAPIAIQVQLTPVEVVVVVVFTPFVVLVVVAAPLVVVVAPLPAPVPALVPLVVPPVLPPVVWANATEGVAARNRASTMIAGRKMKRIDTILLRKSHGEPSLGLRITARRGWIGRDLGQVGRRIRH